MLSISARTSCAKHDCFGLRPLRRTTNLRFQTPRTEREFAVFTGAREFAQASCSFVSRRRRIFILSEFGSVHPVVYPI